MLGQKTHHRADTMAEPRHGEHKASRMETHLVCSLVALRYKPIPSRLLLQWSLSDSLTSAIRARGSRTPRKEGIMRRIMMINYHFFSIFLVVEINSLSNPAGMNGISASPAAIGVHCSGCLQASEVANRQML